MRYKDRLVLNLYVQQNESGMASLICSAARTHWPLGVRSLVLYDTGCTWKYTVSNHLKDKSEAVIL